MIISETKISIPFHDIDIMEIAWHGHYLKYFEIARSDLMSRMKLDWTDVRDLGIALPVVDVQIRYRKPLKYGRSYVIKVELEDIEYPELNLTYSLECPETNTIHCTGSTRQVYLDVAAMNTCFTVPSEIYNRLKTYADKI